MSPTAFRDLRHVATVRPRHRRHATATAVAATATATAATATAAAAATIFTRACFVYGQVRAHEFVVVEFFHGRLGFVIGGHRSQNQSLVTCRFPDH